MFELAFTVPGLPAPQGSKRYVPTAQGPRGRESNERSLRLWRAAVSGEAALAMAGRSPYAEAVHLEVVFSFPRPRAHYRTGRLAGQLRDSAPRYCGKRPDLDKLLRALGDCLSGVVLIDDGQVASLVASKVYGQPSCTVRVQALTLTGNPDLGDRR